MTARITVYLCIECPLGCRLEVEERDGDAIEVRGFSCKRGSEYARQEHVDLRRTLTTTVSIPGARWPRLPVRTERPIPRARVRDVCRALRAVHVTAPVALGDVVAHDVGGLGVDVVATRAMSVVATPV